MSKKYLERIAKESSKNFNGNLSAATNRMTYPLQMNLFKGISSHENGLRVKLGSFYEILTQGIYGGDIKTRHERNSFSLEGSLLTEPDVSSRKYYRESKGIRQSGDLKLLDDQIVKYFLLEMKESKKKKVNFDIFRHDIMNLQSKYKTLPLNILIDDLADNTLFSMSIPFSVIFEIYNSGGHLTSRYDGEKYSKLTRIKSSGVNELFFNTEESIKSLGIDVNNLSISRSNSPSNITINNKKIKPFPILTIENHAHDKWRKSIEERFDSREGIIPQFYSAINGLEEGFSQPIESTPINDGLFSVDNIETGFNLSDDDVPF